MTAIFDGLPNQDETVTIEFGTEWSVSFTTTLSYPFKNMDCASLTVLTTVDADDSSDESNSAFLSLEENNGTRRRLAQDSDVYDYTIIINPVTYA